MAILNTSGKGGDYKHPVIKPQYRPQWQVQDKNSDQPSDEYTGEKLYYTW